MLERQEHPAPPEPGSEHPRPPVHGEHPEHPRPHELEQLRPIAEDLITALESEDRELKIEAVVGVLSRFELKKVEEPAKAWERVGLLAYLFRPKKERIEPRP